MEQSAPRTTTADHAQKAPASIEEQHVHAAAGASEGGTATSTTSTPAPSSGLTLTRPFSGGRSSVFGRQSLVVIVSFAYITLWYTVASMGGYLGPPGADFYQMWLGAREILHGASPYSAVVQTEMSRAYGVWGQHGLPYPLPALLAVVPFAILPLHMAVATWMTASMGAVASMAFLQRRWQYALVLPFLFVPLFRTAGLRQPTLMWVGMAILLVLALQRRWSIVAGLCLALLPAKPQAGLVIALVGVVWAWRNERRAFWWALGWGTVIWGGSTLVMPNWIGDVLHSMVLYRSLYTARWLLPLGALVVLAALRLPWWCWASVLQVVLFPIHDVYCTLPLVLGWAAIGGPLALVGAGLSLLWVVLDDVAFVPRLWLSIFLPFMCAALWRSYGEVWFRHWWDSRADVRPARMS